MVQQSKTTLKSYFKTGDKPTEAQFVDLIDSYENIEDNTGDEKDYVAPLHVFGIDNPASNWAREVVPRLYAEGLFMEEVDLLMNNKRALPIYSNNVNTSDTETTEVDIDMIGDNFEYDQFSIDFIKTKSTVAKTNTIQLMMIGDSMTSVTPPYPDNEGNANVVALLKEMSVKDNVDDGDDEILLVTSGTVKQDAEFSYKDVDYTENASHEGRGARTSADYLRHAWLIYMGADFDDAYATWQLYGLETYDKDGNVRATSQPYTGSTEQLNEYGQTVFGRNPVDYSEEVYTYLSGTGTWTGSAAQIQYIDDFVTAAKTGWLYLVWDYPNIGTGNPFFDFDTAVVNGYSHAFSIAEYIAKYKTIAADGVTRLTKGVDGGTAWNDAGVSQSLYDSYNITSVLTHVAIAFGGNETQYGFTDTIVTQTKTDMMLMAEAITSELPSANVSFWGYRRPGYYILDNCPDNVVPTAINTDYNDFYYKVNSAIKDEVGSLSNQETERIYQLSTFQTQDPSSSRYTAYLEDASGITGGTILKMMDDSHIGYYASLNVALQVLGWTYYTLT